MKTYGIHNIPPEELAYAMARFSRSSDGFADSLKWIRDQKKSSSAFINQYYFDFGHASIADLAHSAFAFEGITHLEAFYLWQEPLFDGQEQSTRYQDYSNAQYHKPEFEQGSILGDQYDDIVKNLLGLYTKWTERMKTIIKDRCPRPEAMVEAAYERTVNARAFDYARHFLPMCLKTNMGLIMSGRTLERTLVRLRTLAAIHGIDQFNVLADSLQQAAQSPSFDGEGFGGVETLPTLARYTERSKYEVELREWLRGVHRVHFGFLPATNKDRPTVERIVVDDLEVEIAATLLWTTGGMPFSYYVEQFQTRPRLRREVIKKVSGTRGKHDVFPKEFRAGQKFIFEIAIDMGSVRDMNRHRRCVTLYQPIAGNFGVAKPGPLITGQDYHEFESDIKQVQQGIPSWIRADVFANKSAFLKTFGHVQPMLMKMDWEEWAYITELRSGVKGHHAYRDAAWWMYELGKADVPIDLRVTPPEVDELLTR